MKSPYTVPDVVEEARAIYRRNCVGRCLHIVLEDNNVKDDHVIFCLETAVERDHADCIKLAQKLVMMSKTQRLKLSMMDIR